MSEWAGFGASDFGLVDLNNWDDAAGGLGEEDFFFSEEVFEGDVFVVDFEGGDF